MKIFDCFNFLRIDNSVIGLRSLKQNNNEEINNPKLYTSDYSSKFKFNLEKRINPMVGQNLYYLS